MTATDIPPEIAALQHSYRGEALRDYLGRLYDLCFDIELDEPDRREALSTESQQWLDGSMAKVWVEDWRERFGPLPLEELRAHASKAINDIDDKWVCAMEAAENGEPFDNAHEQYSLALHRECCDLDEERYRKVLDRH